jgi:hypothetical protein
MVRHSVLTGTDLHYPLGDSRVGQLNLAANTGSAFVISDAGDTANHFYLAITTNNSSGSAQIALGNNTNNPYLLWASLSGGWWFNGTFGTNGQVLTSQGTGATPQWTTIGGGTGTTNATYTINSGAVGTSASNGALIIMSGDGTGSPNDDLVEARIELNPEPENIWFRIRHNRHGAGMVEQTCILELQTAAQTANLVPSIIFNEGNGSNARPGRMQFQGNTTVSGGCFQFDNGSGTHVCIACHGAGGSTSEAFGQDAQAQGSNSLALGVLSNAGSNDSTSIGYNSLCQISALGIRSVAVGSTSQVFGANCIAIGASTTINSSADDCVLIGYGSSIASSRTHCIVIGYQASITGSAAANTTVIGDSALGTHASAIALGSHAATAGTNTFAMGSDTAQVTTMYLGRGLSSATPDAALVIQGTNGSGSNIQGTSLSYQVGLGTGSGAARDHIFYGHATGTSGTTLATSAERARITGTEGNLRVGVLDHGQYETIASLEEVINTTSGTTQDSVGTIPAGALILHVVARVGTAITGAAAWGYGWSTDGTANRYSAGALALAVTLGTQSLGYDSNGPQYATAATHIRIQSSGATFTAGAVRITAYYFVPTAPTS